MKLTSNDFSSECQSRWLRYGKPWFAVLVLHLLVAMGVNSALSLSRDASIHQVDSSLGLLSVTIVPQKSLLPVERKQAKPIEPMPVPHVATPVLQDTSVMVAANQPPVIQPARSLRVTPPEPVILRYAVTKGGDSAKASLVWRVDSEQRYELSYEASYFGVSLIKQISSGMVGATGLLPTRFSDKRRGKSEQAAHFDHEKNVVTFSNNRPEARLLTGTQDRSSVLIQLASLYAGDPAKFKVGAVIDLPVASVDEVEMWSFEVQSAESIALPVGQVQTVHLLRRPRRAFDQTIEVWLAPGLAHLPVRIKYTDASGVTDSQLTSRE